MDKTFRIGEYDPSYNRLLGIDLDRMPVYQSKGLQSHLMKHRHYKAIKYLTAVPDIILSPDYIGSSVNNDILSIEYVKRFDDNIMIVIKLNADRKRLYLATMFELPDKKLDRFLHNGRLKKIIDKSDTELYDKDANNDDSDEPEKVPGAPDEGT